MKQCTYCGLQKPLSEYNKKKASKDGHATYCRECNKAYKKNWAIKNPDKIRHHGLQYYYGISLEQFEDMRLAQDNKCAICKEEFIDSKHTHLDHCHSTKEIRGILCNHCNRGLGGFRDNIKLLQNAQEYLLKHQK